MIYDKPKVTIDLNEYNQLLAIAKDSKEVVNGVTENELSQAVLGLLTAQSIDGRLKITKSEIDRASKAAGIDIRFIDDPIFTSGNSTKIIFRKK